MKREEIDKMAEKILQDFEQLKPQELSSQWEQELFLKLSEAARPGQSKGVGLKAIVVIIIFLLINGLAFLQPNRVEEVRTSGRERVLENISEQLLINSTASN